MKKFFILMLLFPSIAFSKTNLCEELANSVWKGEFVLISDDGRHIFVDMNIIAVLPQSNGSFAIMGRINHQAFDARSFCFVTENSKGVIINPASNSLISFNSKNFNSSHMSGFGQYENKQMLGNFSRQ